MKTVFLVAVLFCGIVYTPTKSTPLTSPRLAADVVESKIKTLLEKATPASSNDTMSMIEDEIFKVLAQIEAPEDQPSPAETEIQKRAFAKVILCRKLLIYLKDTIPPPNNSECRELVQLPETVKLLALLLEITEETLKEMDEYIARNLVVASLGMHCMPNDGSQEWVDWNANLVFCIEALNLKWP